MEKQEALWRRSRCGHNDLDPIRIAPISFSHRCFPEPDPRTRGSLLVDQRLNVHQKVIVIPLLSLSSACGVSICS